MKKSVGLLAVILGCLISTLAHADDANLKINIAGTGKNNTYFLCLDGIGCVSMFASAHGKTYPLTPGSIERIFMVDRTNLRTYFQPLPASCNVNVNSKQTLVVKGKVVNDGSHAHIDHLECSVA